MLALFGSACKSKANIMASPRCGIFCLILVRKVLMVVGFSPCGLESNAFDFRHGWKASHRYRLRINRTIIDSFSFFCFQLSTIVGSLLPLS